MAQSGQNISKDAAIENRSKIDARLAQESAGQGDNTVHGIPPFTVPRADGTLEASPDIRSNAPRTATARMMRRRQGEMTRGDQDGDGDHTNQQGYRDGSNDYQNEDGTGNKGGHQHHHAQQSSGLGGTYASGFTSKRPLLQRLRKAAMPTLVGGLFAWYFDAVGVLIYRNDPRIKGTLLTFSLLCLLTMLSIFFYLEFIRPRLLKKPTVYVNWEKELLYPVRIATACLVVGLFGANIALWPVWHFSTVVVLTALAVAAVNVLGIVF
ncbi:hypothetical protein KVV02_002134 [Mortierella alpina]|uniref:Uncharacterized protein n=1 Tax=Mortierella alpina TaxID=64518 RepID=A0A9P7ZZE0_MORAP|nr:hypothetical protein KVV02_002134 [Mortierella alpina]